MKTILLLAVMFLSLLSLDRIYAAEPKVMKILSPQEMGTNVICDADGMCGPQPGAGHFSLHLRGKNSHGTNEAYLCEKQGEGKMCAPVTIPKGVTPEKYLAGLKSTPKESIALSAGSRNTKIVCDAGGMCAPITEAKDVRGEKFQISCGPDNPAVGSATECDNLLSKRLAELGCHAKISCEAQSRDFFPCKVNSDNCFFIAVDPKQPPTEKRVRETKCPKGAKRPDDAHWSVKYQDTWAHGILCLKSATGEKQADAPKEGSTGAVKAE